MRHCETSTSSMPSCARSAAARHETHARSELIATLSILSSASGTVFSVRPHSPFTNKETTTPLKPPTMMTELPHDDAIMQHDPMDRNQELAWHHVPSATSETQVCSAESTTRLPASQPTPRAIFFHVRASMESPSPQQLAPPGPTSRDRV